MRFYITTIVLLRTIIAIKLIKNNKKQNPYTNPPDNDNSKIILEDVDGKTFLGLYNVNDIGDCEKYIKYYKKNLEVIFFDKCSTKVILAILEKSAEYVENKLEIQIKDSKNSSEELPDVSERFLNINISSLVFENFNFDKKLKKAIFNVLVKKGNIDSLCIADSKILLENEEDLFTILRNKTVNINNLTFDQCEINDETITELFNIMKDVSVNSIVIDGNVSSKLIKECLIDLLETGINFPNFEYHEISKLNSKGIEITLYKISKSNSGTKLEFNFIPQEQSDLNRIFKAILKNNNSKITEIDFDPYLYRPWQYYENETKEFESIFKDLCEKGILINTGILKGDQKTIMKKIRAERKSKI